MAKAVLLTINYETEDVMWSFMEGSQAILRAGALWESIEKDWPGYSSVIVGDEEATKENTKRILNVLGLEEQNVKTE